MEATPRFRGVTFETGDATIPNLIIPSLTIDQAEELAAQMDIAEAPTSKLVELSRADLLKHVRSPEGREMTRKAMRAAKVVISAAIRRNYPDISDATIGAIVTVRNYAEMYAVALGREAKKEGEAPAPAASGTTGVTSTGEESAAA